MIFRSRGAKSVTTTCLLVSHGEAFSISYGRARRCPLSRCYTMADEDFRFLLDELVLLHDQVDLSTQSTDADIDHEIKNFRKNELATFVEELVLDQCDEEVSQDSEATTTSMTANSLEDLNINQLTQLLDHAILEGYQATFSDEELEAWVVKIDTLRLVLQEKLAQSTPKELPSTTESLDFEKRLSQLKQFQTVVSPRASVQLPIAMPAEMETKEKVMVEDVAPAIPGSSINIDTPNSVAVESIEVVEADVPINVVIEEDLSNETSETAVVQQQQKSDGPDAISAAFSAAALGAMAVTKLPVFAAGVALGPLVKQTISYARGRQAAAKKNKNSIDESEIL